MIPPSEIQAPPDPVGGPSGAPEAAASRRSRHDIDSAPARRTKTDLTGLLERWVVTTLHAHAEVHELYDDISY